MQHIEEQAIERFQKNIQFFTEKYPVVAQKLQTLTQALENGTYKEKYALDYIDGYFDAIELQSNNYLYAQDAHHVSQELTKRVNFKKDSFIFDGFPMYNQYEKAQKNFGDKLQGFEGIYPLMSYYLQHSKPTDSMKKIEKFIFIGVGLAGHLIEIHKKIVAEEYFIIEDDIELFRLSLFVTPYYELQNATLFFSIAENQKTFTIQFKKFLSDSFFRNKYLKYSYFPAHSDEKIKMIQSTLASQSFSTFPYKTLLTKYLKPLDFLNKEYQVLNLAVPLHTTELSTKPLLLVAAGPSLDTHLEWLQKNHTRFTILALSATLKALYKHNIKPDIVTHLDGFDISLKHFEGFETEEYLKDSIAIFGSFTPLQLTQHFQKKNIYFVEDMNTEYNKSYGALAGPDVGSTSIMWATTIGFKSIYLLGMDLALAEDGLSHSKTHQITKTTFDTQKPQELSSSISFRKNLFFIKGNFREKVLTRPLFYSSIQSLAESLAIIKSKSQTIYNLNDGAYLEHTVPLKVDTIDLDSIEILDKSSLQTEIHHLFTPYTSTKLTQEDRASLQRRVDFAYEVKNKILHYSKQALAFRIENYLYNLFSLALALLITPTRENKNLIDVYDYYLSYTMPIIFDFFNTQKLENVKKHIKKIDKIFLNEIIEIEKIYEERVEKFLKEVQNKDEE